MSYPEPPKPKAVVRRAGKMIANGSGSKSDVDLVDAWRASHGYVINTFQAWLKKNLERANVNADFAQRLKRRKTVVDKLRRRRPDGTLLIGDVTAMHDFAGCRLIFNSLEDLYKFRNHMRSSAVMQNVNHELRTGEEKYDYIKQPKASGYRGIHDVYRHFPRPHRRAIETSEPWHGLLAEIQYRTRIQHAWATALEISDIIDGQRTKFELVGSNRHRFFAIASELIARTHERLTRAFLDLSTNDLQGEFSELEHELGILQRLDALRQFDGFDNLGKHNVLNIVFSKGSFRLEVYRFRSPNQAIEKANELESDLFSVNAVYVRADNPAQLRSAYRNYFNDPVDFVNLVKAAM